MTYTKDSVIVKTWVSLVMAGGLHGGAGAKPV